MCGRAFSCPNWWMPLIADAALYVAAALEVFALVFFAGALWNFVARRVKETQGFTAMCFTFEVKELLLTSIF